MQNRGGSDSVNGGDSGSNISDDGDGIGNGGGCCKLTTNTKHETSSYHNTTLLKLALCVKL